MAPSTVRLAVTETLVQETRSLLRAFMSTKDSKAFSPKMWRANQEVTLNPRSTTLRTRIRATVNQPRKLITLPLVNAPIN